VCSWYDVIAAAAFAAVASRVDVKTKVAYQHGPTMSAKRARPHKNTESTTHIKPSSVGLARYTPGSFRRLYGVRPAHGRRFRSAFDSHGPCAELVQYSAGHA